MLRAYLMVLVGVFGSIACSWGESKESNTAELTYVKVEVRGRLVVAGEMGKLPALDAVATSTSPVWPYNILEESALRTGVSIVTGKRTVPVYFGDDSSLRDLAMKLNGRMVILAGELEELSYMPATTNDGLRLMPMVWQPQLGWTFPQPGQLPYPPPSKMTFIQGREIKLAPSVKQK